MIIVLFYFLCFAVVYLEIMCYTSLIFHINELYSISIFAITIFAIIL